jgi:hypothetical protein
MNSTKMTGRAEENLSGSYLNFPQTQGGQQCPLWLEAEQLPYNYRTDNTHSCTSLKACAAGCAAGCRASCQKGTLCTEMVSFALDEFNREL